MWGSRLSGNLWATLHSALHFGVDSRQRETTSGRGSGVPDWAFWREWGTLGGFQQGREMMRTGKTKGLDSEN